MASKKKIRTTGNAAKRQMRIAKKMAIRDGGIYGYRVQEYCLEHHIDQQELLYNMTLRQQMEMLKNLFCLKPKDWNITRNDVSFLEDGGQWEIGFQKDLEKPIWWPFELFGYETELTFAVRGRTGGFSKEEVENFLGVRIPD